MGGKSVSGEGERLRGDFAEFGKWLCAGGETHVSGVLSDMPCRKNVGANAEMLTRRCSSGSDWLCKLDGASI